MSRMLVLALALFCTDALPLSAQRGVLERMGRRAARTVESTVSNHVAARIRGATQCALDDTRCAEEARDRGERAVYVDEDGQVILDAEGNPVTDPEDARAAREAPGTGVWRNYDFVPGSRVLFALDLSSEPIGRWPASQVEFVRGNGQVVELDGDTVIEFSSNSVFDIPLPETLPEDFTVELAYRAGAPNLRLELMVAAEEGRAPAQAERDYINLYRLAGIYREGQTRSNIDRLDHVATEFVPFKLQVDGDSERTGDSDYAILYAGTERAGQVPNARFERGNVLRVHVNANQRRRSYLTDVVVAGHGTPLYDALTEAGSFTTRGILFDFDSDRLRGESTPTLEELRRTLEQHPDLRVTIEGHTDASGEDDYNQELSERRAQAVVRYLVDAGIDEGRLAAVGLGESQPVASNDDEAGRQQNRRVVIRSGR